MVKSIVRIPTISHGDWDSDMGFLHKVLTHEAPLTVGLIIKDDHLLKIDDSGDRKKRPIVEKVCFDTERKIYFVLTSEIEIQGKFLDQEKWEWQRKDDQISNEA